MQEVSLFSCYRKAGEKSKESHNMCPNIQSQTESEVAIIYSFVAILHSLQSITDE